MLALLIYKPENGRILFANQETLRLLGYDNLWDFLAGLIPRPAISWPRGTWTGLKSG